MMNIHLLTNTKIIAVYSPSVCDYYPHNISKKELLMESIAAKIQKIKEARENKTDFEITVPKSITGLVDCNAPKEWTDYYFKDYLTPEICAIVCYACHDNGRNDLFQQEIISVLNGASLHHKAHGNDEVSIRISWNK